MADIECRICGCTETDACFDEDKGVVCSWVDVHLCSFCAIAEGDGEAQLPAEPLIELATEGDLNNLVRQRAGDAVADWGAAFERLGIVR